MCLDKVTKKFKTPQAKRRIGYKICRINPASKYKGKLASFWYNLKGRAWHGKSNIRLGQEYTALALPKIIYAGDAGLSTYKPGFHVIKTKSAAKKYLSNVYDYSSACFALAKVEYWDVTARGYEEYYPYDKSSRYPIDIAQKIKYLEVVDKVE